MSGPSPPHSTDAAAGVAPVEASTLDSLLELLFADGFVIIPRELAGLTEAECAVVHEAQLREIRDRFPGWDCEDAATASDVHSEMGKALAGGFLGVQLLPEQLSLEFDPRIKALFTKVFSKLYHKAYDDEVLVWLERSNVSFAEPLRSRVGQSGALPHIDHNPWAGPLDVDAPYDRAKWEPKVRVAGLHEVRPMEKDRPVQGFIALSDCAGGPMGGGMGMSRRRDFFEYLRSSTPPHGRNGHWGKLTRIYPKPGGAKLKALSKEALEALTAAHGCALDAIEYPSYRTGDAVLWLRETLHAGPMGNESGVHGARLYIGGLPNNVLNRDAVTRQWEKLLDGQQAHGRARDRREASGNIGRLLTPEQQRRAGADFAEARAAGGAAGEVDAHRMAHGEAASHPREDVCSDESLFRVSSDAVGLGFKNATAIVNLREPIKGLPLGVGDRVFVKIGESASDAEFAVACAGLRRELGLASTVMCVVWVRPTIDWAALAERAKPKWGNGVRMRLRKAIAASPLSGALPAIVAGAFEGARTASEAPAEVAAVPSGGIELLRVLLFRKFVGSADTNGRNLLFRVSDGDGALERKQMEILSVDETAADAAQLTRSAGSGLQTAQSMNAILMSAARAALVEQPAAVAQILRALRSLELPAVVAREGRLAAVHAREPFDEATLAALDTADAQVLARLATRLGLGRAGDEAKRKRA
jgi:hypothetical protein